ncbi:MAG: trypsin-like peptidase domain-containing protein [Halioglobus sp.]|nr:trypsin-like peptidase domain-containing protein [Halioglobus sp.]
MLSADSSAWLRAVGKLQVPGQRYSNGHRSHFLEDCSATLISLAGQREADTIITAWHCLELYGDLSKPIVFVTTTASGEPVKRHARRLADGGGMHADWAILRLRRSVSSTQITSLNIHPQMANPSRPVTMAGYSNSNNIDGTGETLTFDPACAIRNQQSSFSETNCMAHKGASGGAVIQLSDGGKPWMSGVISQGDGKGRSTFVPVSMFRSAINLHLQ